MQPDRKLRPDERARAHLDAPRGPLRFTRDGITIRYSEPRPLYDRTGRIVVGVRTKASAFRGGDRLPESDGWHHFVNPPTQVPHGDGFRFDPAAALEDMLFQSIIFTARSLGWQG